jgi:Sec-independent protein secretion pathway component TatC
MFAIHMAFFAGFILASPFILYFVGQFVMPALKIREKKYFMRAFYFGTVLFLGGVSFAYFGVMPAAIKFAVVYADWMGHGRAVLERHGLFELPVQIHAGHGGRF